MNNKLLENLVDSGITDFHRDANPSEIQHPTDLISTMGYYELTYFLVMLKVLPVDVHLITSSYWQDYEV